MAAIMLTPAQRDSYLELARMWRKLANETSNHRLRVAAWTRKVGMGASAPTPGPTGFDAGDKPGSGGG
ncbi:MAG: hypothetical protein ACHP84_05380 [Caulobacterales bacterium]